MREMRENWEKTGVRQVTVPVRTGSPIQLRWGEEVSYSYADSDHASCFGVVARDKVAELLAAVRKLDIY